jgi:8-oxo-dGTP pyrophosphatase MutT (NUDIX family)
VSGFRRLGEEEVHRGPVIWVGHAKVETPEGHEIEREIVHHPGAVVVVPVSDAGTVLLVRQYRAALDRDLLELPAGKRDVEGEPPEVTANRELGEEIGRHAGRLDLLANFWNSPGFSDEYTYLYLAQDLTVVETEPQHHEEAHLVVEEIPLRQVPARIAAGDITDAKTLIGLLLTLRELPE